MKSTLSAEVIGAITDGSHGDPFSVLGLHLETVGGKEKLVFRGISKLFGALFTYLR